MTNKSNSTQQKPILLKEITQGSPQSEDQFLLIDQRILRLRRKRERLHVNQSLTLTKEIKKMMGEEFSPEMALAIFDKTWTHASNSQRKEWSSHTPSFRHFFKPHRQKSEANNSVSETTGIPEVRSHELS